MFFNVETEDRNTRVVNLEHLSCPSGSCIHCLISELFLPPLDLDDEILVRTPWLLDAMRNKRPLDPDDKFSTEKGVGQGDDSSTLLWIAAFDVPITALASISSCFKVLDLTDLGVEVTDIAYADDVVSVVASPEILQEKADVMS